MCQVIVEFVGKRSNLRESISFYSCMIWILNRTLNCLNIRIRKIRIVWKILQIEMRTKKYFMTYTSNFHIKKRNAHTIDVVCNKPSEYFSGMNEYETSKNIPSLYIIWIIKQTKSDSISQKNSALKKPKYQEERKLFRESKIWQL